MIRDVLSEGDTRPASAARARPGPPDTDAPLARSTTAAFVALLVVMTLVQCNTAYHSP